MADITGNTYNELKQRLKVIFQRGKDVLDSELNELQDMMRIQARRRTLELHGNGYLNELEFYVESDEANPSTLTIKKGAGDIGRIYLAGLRLFIENDIPLPPANYLAGNPPVGAETHYLYLKLTEDEIDGVEDTTIVNSTLGSETTRRVVPKLEFFVDLTIPADTVADLHEGGARYLGLARIERTASPIILNADVHDIRPALNSGASSYVDYLILTEGGDVTWDAGIDELSFTADFTLISPERAWDYTISSPIGPIADNEVVYLILDPTGGDTTPTPLIAANGAVPADPNLVVLGIRRGSKFYFSRVGGNLELEDGETNQLGDGVTTAILTLLGIADENVSSFGFVNPFLLAPADSVKVALAKLDLREEVVLRARVIDFNTSVLPATPAVTIDGEALVNGDLVLFTHAALNGLYKVAGIGVAATWTKLYAFAGGQVPISGSMVRIKGGTDYLRTIFSYDVTIGWKPMETHLLESEPTGFPNRVDTEISFDDGTRTFTIEPTSPATYFDYVAKGVIYRKFGPQTIVIPDLNGQHYIYYDGATLTTSQVFTEDVVKKFAFIARIYWDSVNNVAIILGDERHGITLDGATHKYLHFTNGTRWVSGLSLGNFTIAGTGALDSEAQASVSDGNIYDEDIDMEITDAAVPSNPFEQILDPIAEIPVFYRSGASGDWLKDAATAFPVKQGTARIKYNDPAGPWTTPDATGDGKFVAMWIFASHNIFEPVVAVLGQREDNTLSDAQANNTYDSILFGDIPALEMKVLYRLIFETDSTWANTPKAVLRDVKDLRRAVDVSIGSYSASDHGLLTGLNDPDHAPTAVTTAGVTKDGGFSASDTDLQQSLDTINKILGQFRLKPHATLNNRLVITGAERILNSGTTLIQTLKSLIADFDGAQIDFETGSIYKADGVTALGINFTPFSIPATQYFYYSVHVVASTVNANNTITAQVLVLPASGANAVLANAPRPAFARGATPIGVIWVQEDAGGVAAITAANIGQLGTGVGGGSGSVGPGQLFIEELRRRLEDDGMVLNWLTANVPEVHEEDRIDGSSTGAYDIANGEYDFDTAEFLLSTQHYGAQFLLNEQDNLQAELHALWTDGFVDDAATYELSKDGGATLEVVTMERVGESNKFRGVHVFAEPAGTTQFEYPVANADTTVELNATTEQAYAIPLGTLAAGVKKKILTGNIYVSKTGTPTGDLRVKLVKDDTALPGATIVGQNSDTIAVSSLIAGNNTIAVEIPAILVAGDYWLVIETTDAYKASFVTATHVVAVRVSTGGFAYSEGDSYRYNGTVWSVHAGNQAVFQLFGYTYDLRVKITASQTSSLLGLGVFYGEQNTMVFDEHQAIQRFDIDGDLDTTELTLTKFIPDPMACRVYIVNSGQVLRFPAFAVDGRKLIFAAGQFLSPGNTIIVLVDQSEAQVFDNSDMNANLLASNHLGSTDATIDRSLPGRGIIVQRPDGTKREITLDNSDNIVVLSVP